MDSDHRVKLSDYVADFVAGLGIRHLFTLPGGGCMHLTDSFGQHPDIENICNLHEQVCAVAADAYSQYSGNLGVCLVTTGPGGTNTLTGVAGSWLDSIPILVISGQVKTADMTGNRKIRQMGFQEINIVKLAEPVTKYAVTVTNPDQIAFQLEKAVHLAKTGRPGPAWIDIPLDIQAKMIEVDSLDHFKPETEVSGLSDNELRHVCESLTEILLNAKRPVILAGNGVRISGGLNIFKSLIHQLKIPVLTTWKAIDFLEDDHPYYCGRPGAIGQRGANFVQQNADMLIVLGARLDFGQTGYNHMNFAPNAKICMVDIDPAEIDKMECSIELPVQADCHRFLSMFDQNIRTSGFDEKINERQA
ncbi:MAG: thiamine pyrophosphate-binding protein, partial [Fidelibacterota bacterium]